MCGIHLIIDKKQQIASAQPVQSMMLSCTYRGPDAEGFLSVEGTQQKVWMAANRLKIIDPAAAADQPMTSPCGRYTLIYNGEIYNYHDLRNQLLQQGEQFTTRSDTEVLLKLLIKEGKMALPRLHGMFAFAFYDQQEARLLAARDRFGMKPLYYFEDASYLLLSSETKSILASGLAAKQMDEKQIFHYLHFKYAAPGYTFFRNIRSLPPGCLLEKKGKKDCSIQPFHTHAPVSRTQLPLDESGLVQKTENLLTEAVLKHLEADVPGGLFLSGGIDSTLLLAMIKKQGAHPVPTFSIVNDSRDRSFGTRDYYYASRAAEMYGSRHYELVLQPKLVEEAWEDYLKKTDQPIGDSASLMTYLLAREAKKVAGVVLSGAGADELFGGYNRHLAFQQYLKHFPVLQKSMGLLKLARYLPAGFPHPWRKQFRLLKKLGQSLTHDPVSTYQHFTSLPIMLPSQVKREEPAASSHPLPPGAGFVEKYLRYALDQDLHHYLPFDVLALSDSMSMAQSLEMRMPYLDVPLVDFACQIPAAVRLKNGRKWILKRILDSYGGKTFTRRSKEGFGLPIGAWLRQDAYRFLRQPLENPKALLFQFVSFREVQQMLQAHTTQKTDHAQELWALLLLSTYLSHHFD